MGYGICCILFFYKWKLCLEDKILEIQLYGLTLQFIWHAIWEKQEKIGKKIFVFFQGFFYFLNGEVL